MILLRRTDTARYHLMHSDCLPDTLARTGFPWKDTSLWIPVSDMPKVLAQPFEIGIIDKGELPLTVKAA